MLYIRNSKYCRATILQLKKKKNLLGKKSLGPYDFTGKFSISLFSHEVVSTLAIPWNIAYQAPLSMGFSRQEYWSGLPFPSTKHLKKK